MSWKSGECNADPSAWITNAIGVDLSAPGLDSLASRVVAGAEGTKEQALALFGHVSAMPFRVSDARVRTSPPDLHAQDAGDAYFKGTLLLHLLRLRGIPARQRWVQLHPPQVTRGLWDFVGMTGAPFFYPLTEISLDGRWCTVDAYVVDPPLFRAVQTELRQRRASSVWFVHRDGVCGWDGSGDALQRFCASDPASLPLRDLGCFHSHADFLRVWRSLVPETELTLMAYENQSRLMNEALEGLRRQA